MANGTSRIRARVCASKSLAGSGRPDQQDVGFRKLHFAAALLIHLDALVVVVNRDRQLLLGGVLADHVLIQVLFQFQRLGELTGRAIALLMPVVFDDRIADCNAFVADVGARIIAGGGDQFTDDVLAFMTERTTEGIVGSGAFQTGSPTEKKIKRPLAPIGRLLRIQYVLISRIRAQFRSPIRAPVLSLIKKKLEGLFRLDGCGNPSQGAVLVQSRSSNGHSFPLLTGQIAAPPGRLRLWWRNGFTIGNFLKQE